jgi:hypothetical protein
MRVGWSQLPSTGGAWRFVASPFSAFGRLEKWGSLCVGRWCCRGFVWTLGGAGGPFWAAGWLLLRRMVALGRAAAGLAGLGGPGALRCGWRGSAAAGRVGGALPARRRHRRLPPEEAGRRAGAARAARRVVRRVGDGDVPGLLVLRGEVIPAGVQAPAGPVPCGCGRCWGGTPACGRSPTFSADTGSGCAAGGTAW